MGIKFELTTYTRPEKGVSPETIELVDTLITAVAENPSAAINIQVDVNDEGKELRAIRVAAKDKGKTVRILHRDDAAVTKVGTKENGKGVYQGEVQLTITVTDKYKDGRGRKGGATSEDAPKADKATK